MFSIWYKLMPSEIKSGSWIMINGDMMNIDELWLKARKKGWWYIPRIDKYFGGNK